MLIAVSIFALMGVVAFSGLSQMTRTGQAVADANDRLSDLQFAMVYFSRDWTQVSPRKIRNQYGDEESNIVISDGEISFTRSGWSNLLGHQRSNLQRVQYLVVDNQLVRRHWRSPIREWASCPCSPCCWTTSRPWRLSFSTQGVSRYAAGRSIRRAIRPTRSCWHFASI